MSVLEIDELVGKLDGIFQDTLDRLESQARDAVLIDKAIKQLLDQHDSDEDIMNWDPEKAISPKNAFRALALKLIHASDKANTRTVSVSPLDYEDLLAWPDEPRKRNGSHVEELFQRIEYARAKSLGAFWDQYRTRIAPESDPVQAKISAVTDLINAFAIGMPHEFIVPFSPRGQGAYVMPFSLRRAPHELEWVIRNDTLCAIARANHALATICQLNSAGTLAALILEMNSALHSKLKSSFRKYQPGELFIAGATVSLVMHREHIDFKLSKDMFALVRDAMQPVRGLHFVNTPKLH